MRLRLFAMIVFTLAATGCFAAVVSGQLENGTTGGEGEADRVQLIRLGQGMEIVATQDNVKGSFLLNFDGEITENFLIQAVKGTVTYTERLVNPQETVRVVVYDADEAADLDVRVSSLAFYAEADRVEIGLFYILNNTSSPPRTKTGAASFTFPTMSDYKAMDVSTQRGSMPLRQTVPVDESGLASLSYPLKPGETQMNVRYQFPYDSSGENKYTIPLPGPQSFLHVLVLPLTLNADGDSLTFVEEDQDRGFKVFSWQPTAVSDSVELTLSGKAAPPGAAASQGSGTASQGQSGQGQAGQQREFDQVSHPVGNYVWPITIGMFLLLCGLAYAGVQLRTS